MSTEDPQRFLHPTDRRKAQRRLYGGRKWERVRAAVLARDGYRCQVQASTKCRGAANTVDHIIRPEEGGALYDPANLRASCRSCNMVRHNVAYFRERHDAMMAGRPAPEEAAPAMPERRARPFTWPGKPSGRPSTADAAFAAWAASLHGVSSEPEDHGHGKWEVCPSVTYQGRTFAVCPATCRSPVRFPR